LGLVVPERLTVLDYAEHARSEGAAAEAVAYVVLSASAGESASEAKAWGVGRHADVVLASFHAVLAAVNRLGGSEQLSRRASA
jgi:2-isopropylmalate synthase